MLPNSIETAYSSAPVVSSWRAFGTSIAGFAGIDTLAREGADGAHDVGIGPSSNLRPPMIAVCDPSRNQNPAFVWRVVLGGGTWGSGEA